MDSPVYYPPSLLKKTSNLIILKPNENIFPTPWQKWLQKNQWYEKKCTVVKVVKNKTLKRKMALLAAIIILERYRVLKRKDLRPLAKKKTELESRESEENEQYDNNNYAWKF